MVDQLIIKRLRLNDIFKTFISQNFDRAYFNWYGY